MFFNNHIKAKLQQIWRNAPFTNGEIATLSRRFVPTAIQTIFLYLIIMRTSLYLCFYTMVRRLQVGTMQPSRHLLNSCYHLLNSSEAPNLCWSYHSWIELAPPGAWWSFTLGISPIVLSATPPTQCVHVREADDP